MNPDTLSQPQNNEKPSKSFATNQILMHILLRGTLFGVAVMVAIWGFFSQVIGFVQLTIFGGFVVTGIIALLHLIAHTLSLIMVHRATKTYFYLVAASHFVYMLSTLFHIQDGSFYNTASLPQFICCSP